MGTLVATITTLSNRPRVAVFASKLWRWVAAAGCLAFLAAGLYRQLRPQPYQLQDSDFLTYYHAALAVRHGADPFAPAAAWISTYTAGSPLSAHYYVYAPFFALLLVPLTVLPLYVALVVWGVLNAAFLFGAVYALFRATAQRASLLGCLALTAAASYLSPVRIDIYWGQADILLLFLVCAALWVRLEQRTVVAGLLLAAACVIKPPLLLVVLFLCWKRELRFAAVTACAFLALLLAPFAWLGGQTLADQLTIWRFWSSQYVPFIDNQAFKGVLARLFTVNPSAHALIVAPGLVTALWLVSVAAVLVIACAVVSPAPLQRDTRSLLEMGVVLSATLLISPLMEYIYVTTLVVPLVVLWLFVRERGWRSPGSRWLVLGLALSWLALWMPLQQIEYAFSPHMHAASPLSSLYVLLAPAFLYVVIGVFALQVYALRKTSDLSLTGALRRLPSTARDIAAESLVGARARLRVAQSIGAPARVRAIWGRLQALTAHISRRTWRMLAVVACLMILAVALYRQFHDQLLTPASQLDFHDYYLGALAVRMDADPFAAAARWMRHFTPATPYRTSFFIYAPLFGLLLIPFTYLPFTGALLAWDACNVLFLIVAIYSFLRAADIQPTVLSVLVLTTLGSLASPMRIEYYWGQSDVFLLMLLCLALWAFREQKVTVAGLVLAVACMTKPPLLLLVAFFAWKRQFRLATVTALSTAAMVLTPFVWLGGRALGDMLTVWGFYSNQFIAIAYNDSPKGVLARLFVSNPVVHPLINSPALMNGIWIALVLLIALLTASVVSPAWKRGEIRPLLETGLVVSAILLVSPLSETNHFTLLLLPFLAFYAFLRTYHWRARSMHLLGIITAVAWLAICLPIYEVQNVFVANMTRRSHLADIYVVLAPTYLYVAITVFAFGRYALRLTDSLAAPQSVWRFALGLPLLLRQWLVDTRTALVESCRMTAAKVAQVIPSRTATCRRQ